MIALPFLIAALAAGPPRLPSTMLYDPRCEFSDGAITVRAMDESGRPVAGAEVSCVLSDYLSRFSFELRDSERAVTGEDGTCVFSALKAEGYNIHVAAGELGCWASAYVSFYTKHPVVTATLGKYCDSNGVVRDKDGNPLPGVKLLFRGIHAATTDDQGNFRIRNVEGTAISPEATFVKEGYGTVTQFVWAASDLIGVTMPQGAQVLISVTGDDGKPVPDLAVRYALNGKGLQGITDAAGKLETLFLPEGQKVEVNASLERENISYCANAELTVSTGAAVNLTLLPSSRIVMSETPNRNGVWLKTRYPIDKTSGIELRGCVLTGGSKKPVAATVACSFAKAEIKVRTDATGHFVFAGVPQAHAITLHATPDNPLLCIPQNDLHFRSSEEAVQPLEFRAEEGTCIRGTVAYSDGKPYPYADLLLFPRVKSNPAAVNALEDGSFEFANLLPAKEPAKLVLRRDKTNLVEVPLGKIKPGHVCDNTAITSPPLPEDAVAGTLHGVVTDEAGAPLPCVSVMMPPEFAETPGMTDLDGKFTMKYHQPGNVTLTCERQTGVVFGGEAKTVNIPCAILAGAQLELGTGSTGPVRITAHLDRPILVAGSIQDETGKLMDPSRFLWYGDNSTGTYASTNGGFVLCAKAGEVPQLIELAETAYQARVLISGRDFTPNGTYAHAVLKKGPFPEFQSIFAAVTGIPFAERSKVPCAQRVLDSLEAYRKMAGNDDTIWMRVVDDKGLPVKHIWIWQVMMFRIGLPAVSEGPPESDVTQMESDTGNYRLPQGYPAPRFIWAPGYGRVNLVFDTYAAISELNEVILQPAASLDVRVTDSAGRPIPNASVTLNSTTAPFVRPAPDAPARETTPTTDAEGMVRFEYITPGSYRLHAATSMDNQYMQEEAELTFAPQEHVRKTVVLAPKNPQ